MEGVNLVAQTGFGLWLKDRRGGRSQREVAASARIGERTVQRYEKDDGPYYEFLRLLDALNVDLHPRPRLETARALNVEIQQLRLRLEVVGDKVDDAARNIQRLAKLLELRLDDESDQEQENGG